MQEEEEQQQQQNPETIKQGKVYCLVISLVDLWPGLLISPEQ